MAANYRFCTIEPNTGVVTVPDERLEVLSKISGSQKIVPSVFEFVDIAGLVKGASQGEGSAISSSATSAKWTPSCRWSVALKTPTSNTSWTPSIPSATSRSSTPN
jgi:hypothetical protein